jgi:tetratricopeptide (TPR) repeat protein
MKSILKSTLTLALLLISLSTVAMPVTTEPSITIKSKRPPGLDKFEDLRGPHPARSMIAMDEDIALYPKSATAYIHRGATWMLEGDPENAQRDFTKALKLDPHSAQAHIGLSRICTSELKWDLSFAELQKAEELGSPETSLNALNESAFLHRELKQYDIALKQYNVVVNSKILPKDHRAYALFQRAELYTRTKKFQEAVQDFNEALKLDPTMIEVRFSRAEAYSGWNKLPEAISDYTFVIDHQNQKYPADILGGLESHLLLIYKQRAAVYERMGKSDLAQRDRQLAHLYDKQTLDALPFRPVPIKQH